MGKYVGAIDQGTTSSRFIVFDARRDRRRRAEGARADLSAARLGRASPLEIWRNTEEVIAEALATRSSRAGDLAAVGITNQRETTVALGPQRPAAAQRARLAGHAGRPLVASIARDGGKDRFRASHRAAARDLFQRPQAQVAARQRRRVRAQAPKPATRCSARSTLGAVESHRRPDRRPARHRRHQREPHAAHATCDARVGRRAARRRSRFRARCCRGSRRRAKSTARSRPGRYAACRSPASSATSRRRSSARPASSPARRRTPTAPAVSC